MVAESWLRSKDHEKFARAAVKCENPMAHCMSDGFCHYDGVCFRSMRAAFTGACRAIERAADKQPSDIAREMREAIKLLKESWDAEALPGGLEEAQRRCAAERRRAA